MPKGKLLSLKGIMDGNKEGCVSCGLVTWGRMVGSRGQMDIRDASLPPLVLLKTQTQHGSMLGGEPRID